MTLALGAPLAYPGLQTSQVDYLNIVSTTDSTTSSSSAALAADVGNVGNAGNSVLTAAPGTIERGVLSAAQRQHATSPWRSGLAEVVSVSAGSLHRNWWNLPFTLGAAIAAAGFPLTSVSANVAKALIVMLGGGFGWVAGFCVANARQDHARARGYKASGAVLCGTAALGIAATLPANPWTLIVSYAQELFLQRFDGYGGKLQRNANRDQLLDALIRSVVRCFGAHIKQCVQAEVMGARPLAITDSLADMIEPVLWVLGTSAAASLSIDWATDMGRWASNTTGRKKFTCVPPSYEFSTNSWADSASAAMLSAFVKWLSGTFRAALGLQSQYGLALDVALSASVVQLGQYANYHYDLAHVDTSSMLPTPEAGQSNRRRIETLSIRSLNASFEARGVASGSAAHVPNTETLC